MSASAPSHHRRARSHPVALHPVPQVRQRAEPARYARIHTEIPTTSRMAQSSSLVELPNELWHQASTTVCFCVMRTQVALVLIMLETTARSSGKFSAVWLLVLSCTDNLLSEITGTTDVTTGPPAVAATRPSDVSTTYTALRTSVSAYTTPSQPPIYGTSSTSLSGYESMSGSPGSSPAVSTPSMTMSSLTSSSAGLPSSYGGGSSSAGASPTLSSSGSTSISTSSSSSATGTASSPSQYTLPGGSSSQSSSGSASSSSGMTTSVSQLPTGSTSSSSQSQMMSSSGGDPPIYGGSSSTLSPSNNSPPPYGASSSSSMPASNSLPPYGGSTTSSAPSNNSPPPYGGSTTASVPATTLVTPPAETLCPAYNGRNYTDSAGAVYTVNCNQNYAGTRYTPINQRPVRPYTIQSCIAECNLYAECVAASTDGTECQFFSSVTGTVNSPGTNAVYKVSGPTTPGSSTSGATSSRSSTSGSASPGATISGSTSSGLSVSGLTSSGSSAPGPSTSGSPANVATVTVCANRSYTTVWTTATLTTCPPNSACTAGTGLVGTSGAY
jgi:hypothetical protein